VRELPPGFPIPVSKNAEAYRTPDRLGALFATEMELGEATSKAMATAVAAGGMCDALEAVLPGLGWDYSQGHLHKTLTYRVEHLAALLTRLPALQQIAEELGRMESHSRRTLKSERGGRETVVGVRISGELADALPCELALLGDDETEDMFYHRYSEHRLLCLEFDGSAFQEEAVEEKRGPVVACVDTSGSMQGSPEAVAKALILTVIRRVLPQGRRVNLMLFGGPGDYRNIEVAKGKNCVAPLLEFLALGFHSGTDYDGPLKHSMNLLETEPYRKADILIVTDGLCRASRNVTTQLLEAKASNDFRVISVIVGGDPSGVKDFSDQVWEVNPNSTMQAFVDLRECFAS